jgi:pyridinium-3,5-biscarboxylic acid mononucleotide synthase
MEPTPSPSDGSPQFTASSGDAPPGDARPERGIAHLDHGRATRTGEPEVVYAEHKTPDQVAVLLRSLHARGAVPALATRCSPAHAAALPEAAYDPAARLLVLGAADLDRSLGHVVVVCAGTSDLPIAGEAAGTLEAFGVSVELLVDVGVAGIHRLLSATDVLARADVVIAVAGMEGALPTVVGGLVGVPVVAVPTSIGYGAAFEGVAALLGMLTSCAPGVSVTNIDNGFGAALVARRVLLTGRRLAATATPAPAGERTQR